MRRDDAAIPVTKALAAATATKIRPRGTLANRSRREHLAPVRLSHWSEPAVVLCPSPFPRDGECSKKCGEGLVVDGRGIHLSLPKNWLTYISSKLLTRQRYSRAATLSRPITVSACSVASLSSVSETSCADQPLTREAFTKASNAGSRATSQLMGRSGLPSGSRGDWIGGSGAMHPESANMENRSARHWRFFSRR